MERIRNGAEQVKSYVVQTVVQAKDRAVQVGSYVMNTSPAVIGAAAGTHLAGPPGGIVGGLVGEQIAKRIKRHRTVPDQKELLLLEYPKEIWRLKQKIAELEKENKRLTDEVTKVQKSDERTESIAKENNVIVSKLSEPKLDKPVSTPVSASKPKKKIGMCKAIALAASGITLFVLGILADLGIILFLKGSSSGLAYFASPIVATLGPTVPLIASFIVTIAGGVLFVWSARLRS